MKLEDSEKHKNYLVLHQKMFLPQISHEVCSEVRQKIEEKYG